MRVEGSRGERHHLELRESAVLPLPSHRGGGLGVQRLRGVDPRDQGLCAGGHPAAAGGMERVAIVATEKSVAMMKW